MAKTVMAENITPVAHYSAAGQPITSTNPLPVTVSGSNLAEATQDQSDAVAGVHTFAANVAAIDFWKVDANETATVTVNGTVLVIPSGVQYLQPTPVAGTPSAEVTVAGVTAYFINRYA